MQPRKSINPQEESLPVGWADSKTGPATSAEGANSVGTSTERDRIRGLDRYTAMALREPVMVDPRDVYRPDDARACCIRSASPSETHYSLHNQGCIMRAFASEKA